MCRMTVKEAINCLIKGNGTDYSTEKYNKIMTFLDKLPHKPTEYGVDNRYYIRDYVEGWYVELLVEITANDKFRICVLDCDMFDKNEKTVTNNVEALKILDEYRQIKSAYDLDEHWNMTDDHKYWRKMSNLNHEADIKRQKLLKRL